MVEESIIDTLSQGSITQIIKVFIDANYFDFLLPFLLLFALIFHVVQKILGNKGSKLIAKPVSVIIGLVVSFYSVIYTFPSGYTISDLMVFLFPNISSITIAILCIYVVGSIIGRDFFSNMFAKDINAYTIFFLGGIALGSVVYYIGIVIGLWSFDPYDSEAWISVIFVIFFLILGIVFLIIGWFTLGALLLYVSISFIYNMGEVSIFNLLFDPYLFILFIVIGLMNWLFRDESENLKKKEFDYVKAQKTLKDIEKNYGGKPPKQGEDLLYDITSKNNPPRR